MGAGFDLLIRFSAALSIGLLLGLERGWEQRDVGEGQRVAGFRTFGLVSLFGAVAAALTGDEPWILAAAMLSVGTLAAVGYFRASRGRNDRSATGMVALLLAFALGAMAARGEIEAAAAVAVVVTLLLGFKPELHELIRRIERAELLATIRLLLISIVLLPALPDRDFGPWAALNPYRIWWMVVLVASVSYAGYVAERIWGRDRGTLVAALLGGLVSSTAVTVDLSRRAAASRESYDSIAAGIVVASAIMFLRVLAILTPIAANLAWALAVPVGVTAAIGLVAAALLVLKSRRGESKDQGRGAALRNPLELSSALKFGLLLSVILVLSRALTAALGDRGLYLAAATAGIADVDAITLSIGVMATRGDVAMGTAILAVLLAAGTNTVVKSVIAVSLGGRRLGIRVVPAFAAALVGGGVTVWLIGLP